MPVCWRTSQTRQESIHSGCRRKKPLVIVKPNTLLIELDNTPILTPDKQPVKPTGKFYVTAETIEPYHIVLDITRLGTVTYART